MNTELHYYYLLLFSPLRFIAVRVDLGMYSGSSSHEFLVICTMKIVDTNVPPLTRQWDFEREITFLKRLLKKKETLQFIFRILSTSIP